MNIYGMGKGGVKSRDMKNLVALPSTGPQPGKIDPGSL
jgi:hypothetical protein